MNGQNNRFGSDLGLGKNQAYPDAYDASLLQPIPRNLCRKNLPIQHFNGVDIWTGYELSWLSEQGKPEVAIAEFCIPADSPNIIESKSFKYYLNSFNQDHFTPKTVKSALIRDLSQAAGAPVNVTLTNLGDYQHPPSQLADFECVDTYALQNATYHPAPERLVKHDPSTTFTEGHSSKTQKLCSHLLKSNCPVTGQPDWASLWINIEGSAVKPEDLLAYIISYRNHQDFHENCVEQIFCDLMSSLKPSQLWVYARYTRRGGLDINPFRSSDVCVSPPNVKGARQ